VNLSNPELAAAVTPLENRTVKITGISGASMTIPLAKITLRSPHFGAETEVEILAGVVYNLKQDAILGNDLYYQNPEIADCVEIRRGCNTDPTSKDFETASVNTVVTRSQTASGRNYKRDDQSLPTGRRSTSAGRLQNPLERTGSTDRSHMSDVARSTSHARGVGVKSSAGDGSPDAAPSSGVHEMEITTRRADGPRAGKDKHGVVSDSISEAANDENRSCSKKAFATAAELINETIIPAQQAETVQSEQDAAEPDKQLTTGNEPTACGADRINFIQEQRRDGSLKDLFELAEAGSDKFFIECGVLYRRALGTNYWCYR
jgi:hypothetical protein